MISFDQELHRYTIDGKIIPSVTQIMTNVGFIDNRWFSDEGCVRGTKAHLATEYFDRNELDWFSLDDVVLPYVKAYEKFLKESNFIPEKIEEHFFSELHFYAGKPDRIGRFGTDKRPVILDIKTGQKQKWWPIQLAGYYNLMPNKNAFQCYSLELRQNETYSLKEHKISPREVQAFLSAAYVVNYKNNDLHVKDC